MIEQDCTREGFFRDPSDCTRFYRCIDSWGGDNHQKFSFECPAGTVFDESVSVCNWPQHASPCGEAQPSPPSPPPPPPGKTCDYNMTRFASLAANTALLASLAQYFPSSHTNNCHPLISLPKINAAQYSTLTNFPILQFPMSAAGLLGLDLVLNKLISLDN